MIIAKIIGGLGNQMFQYAAARALTLSRDIPLHLDLTGFEGYAAHQGYELRRVFQCEATNASINEIRSVLKWRAMPIIRRAMSRPELTALRGSALVCEPHFHYWSGFRDIPSTAYVQGYWQSEKYFCDAEQVIRADFAFREPLNSSNAAVAREISASRTAVSLHFRRGDYAIDKRAQATHGLCSLDYYRTAVNYIIDRVEDPTFFIFSDDIPWVKKNFWMEYPCHHITCNFGAESYNDMRLMSICDHHIIANSSFSWWGAWLNASCDKIVIAPKKWFVSESINTEDLFPGGWVKL